VAPIVLKRDLLGRWLLGSIAIGETRIILGAWLIADRLVIEGDILGQTLRASPRNGEDEAFWILRKSPIPEALLTLGFLSLVFRKYWESA
jgi:hypothetical protein